MAAATKTSVKSNFQTGDIPTQAQFEELIDSYQDFHDILQAIATAAQGGGTGVVIIEASADATVAAIGTVGKRIISAETTASVASNLSFMTLDTTQTITGDKVFQGLVRISAGVTIKNTKSQTALRLVATDATAGSSLAPILTIQREYDSGDWAANDLTGGWRFGVVASANSAFYTLADTYVKVLNAATSATDARVYTRTRVADDVVDQIGIGGSAGGVTIGTAATSPLGTGTLNAHRVYHRRIQLAPSLQAFAWAQMNGTGTPAVVNSINIASITDNAAGDYSLVFSTAASDAAYGAQIFIGGSAASSPPSSIRWAYLHTTTANGVRFGVLEGAVGASAGEFERITVTIWDDNPSAGTRVA